MTHGRLYSYIDALVAGRRPAHFPADPEDAEILRTAIELRAARPGDAHPNEKFVSDLYQSLVERADSAPVADVHPLRAHRARSAMFAVAASVVLVGGTFVGTESFTSSPATTAAIAVPHGDALRTGTFETPSGEVLGQVVAYNGHPSWIYMNVGDSQSTGKITCKLQLNNGSIVATGNIELNAGVGELTKSIQVDVQRLRGAQLFSSSGAVLASATFS
ncbi:MAG: hypothetical protein JWM55_1784 [Acidimicrobiaceae bacterium]|nr:hypothetical protein [Acidimicrobiaceae bacterium]